jgi:hypothetical protein
VGLDISQHWISREHSSALGVCPVNDRTAKSLPRFDLIALLSVHHQWISRFGDSYARELVLYLISRSRIGLIIEFAALSEKYGAPPNSMFSDNCEASVKDYAKAWLASGGVEASFLGRAREKVGKEPIRFVYFVRSGGFPSEY